MDISGTESSYSGEMSAVKENSILKVPRVVVMASGAGNLFEELVKATLVAKARRAHQGALINPESCENQDSQTNPVLSANQGSQKPPLQPNLAAASTQQPTQAPPLNAEILALITNTSKAAAITKARSYNIDTKIIDPTNFANHSAWDSALAEQLQSLKPDWIVLAGFLKKLGPQVLATFNRRIVNTHPGPLPQFGGPGMYGHHVHEAVLKSKLAATAITVHLVDAEYDHGPTVATMPIPIEPSETAWQLEARVKALEIQFYPKVLNDLMSGRMAVS